MIKYCIAGSMTIISLGTTIAQPLDYIPELVIPQSVVSVEQQKPIPLYDMQQYRKGQIISAKKILLQDALGFAPGYCTSYVASQRPDLFLGKGENRITGDAKDWLLNAQNAGIDTGIVPQIGAIAVFKPGKGAGSLGHVAIVEYVGDNGLIIVKDMNFQGKNIVTTRVISSDLAAGYIY
ncbi:hypothetical protein XF24_00216 [candidate division SR1 bacterium Aalborg_AAW-1]|nr:hypothetical protein XF24_00216 [candidate division SR1 bacterium Aalborg_AAW-1]